MDNDKVARAIAESLWCSGEDKHGYSGLNITDAMFRIAIALEKNAAAIRDLGNVEKAAFELGNKLSEIANSLDMIATGTSVGTPMGTPSAK